MALSSSDLILLQRGGELKRTSVGELNSKMQDTDLIMVQRGSPGTCSQTSWANKDSLQDSDILMVGNGGTLKKTTWGAVKGSLALTKTIVASNNGTPANESVSVVSLFTAEEAASSVDKVIIVESGALVGSNSSASSAMSISGLTGKVTLINNGQIIGARGASGGAGGNALSISQNIFFDNNGAINGGGGGGGIGGSGGGGSSYLTFVPQGSPNNTSCQGGQYSGCHSHCKQGHMSVYYRPNALCKEDTANCYDNDDPSRCQGSRWKPCCDYVGYCNCPGNNDEVFCDLCEETTYTTGGAGGAGGTGYGYLNGNIVQPTDGSNGSAGGASAGTGGKGGAGGSIQSQGATGQSGGNGNNGSGAAGLVGGAAGQNIVTNGFTITTI